MRRNLFWLSDEQWERIEPHLPTDVRGVERADDRRVISGIVHVLKTGRRRRPRLATGQIIRINNISISPLSLPAPASSASSETV
jgi:hypothetical protein